MRACSALGAGGCRLYRRVEKHLRVDWVGANHPYTRIAQANGNHWVLTPASTGYVADLTLPHWLPAPAAAGLCRNTAGWAWDCGRTSSTAATITRGGVTQLGDWAVGYLNTWWLPPAIWR